MGRGRLLAPECRAGNLHLVALLVEGPRLEPQIHVEAGLPRHAVHQQALSVERLDLLVGALEMDRVAGGAGHGRASVRGVPIAPREAAGLRPRGPVATAETVLARLSG